MLASGKVAMQQELVLQCAGIEGRDSGILLNEAMPGWRSASAVAISRACTATPFVSVTSTDARPTTRGTAPLLHVHAGWTRVVTPLCKIYRKGWGSYMKRNRKQIGDFYVRHSVQPRHSIQARFLRSPRLELSRRASHRHLVSSTCVGRRFSSALIHMRAPFSAA